MNSHLQRYKMPIYPTADPSLTPESCVWLHLGNNNTLGHSRVEKDCGFFLEVNTHNTLC